MIQPEEGRVASRKILKVRARVVLQSGGNFPGRTVDISISGICVMLESPVQPGQVCMILFENLVKGVLKQVSASGKVVYCICGKDGFRTGFQFNQLTPANTAVINDIVAS